MNKMTSDAWRERKIETACSILLCLFYYYHDVLDNRRSVLSLSSNNPDCFTTLLTFWSDGMRSNGTDCVNSYHEREGKEQKDSPLFVCIEVRSWKATYTNEESKSNLRSTLWNTSFPVSIFTHSSPALLVLFSWHHPRGALTSLPLLISHREEVYKKTKWKSCKRHSKYLSGPCLKECSRKDRI